MDREAQEGGFGYIAREYTIDKLGRKEEPSAQPHVVT